MKKVLLFIVMFLPCFIFANQVSNGKYMWDDLNGNKLLDQDDEVCFDTECFYVINNDGVKLTMLAKYNLYAGYVIEDPMEEMKKISYIDPLTPKQNKDYSMRYAEDFEDVFPISATFFAESVYWDSNLKAEYVYSDESEIYKYVEEYKKYLKDLGINVNARLLNMEDLEKLSFVYDENNNKIYSENTNIHKWLYTSAYYTGLQIDGKIFIISNFPENYFSTLEVNNGTLAGIRPVVEIELDDVSYDNQIYIEYVELLDHSLGASNVSVPKIDGLDLELSTMFVNVNDSIKYNVKIKNNTDTLYYLKQGFFENKSDFIKYSYEVNKDRIEPHGEMELIINVSYAKEVTIFDENYYFEFDSSLIELSDIIIDSSKNSEGEILNPFTSDSLVFLVIVLIASGFILYKTRNKKLVLKVLIIGTILTPMLSIGKNYVSYSVFPEEIGDAKFTINFKCNVNIARTDIEENMMVSRGYDEEFAKYIFSVSSKRTTYISGAGGFLPCNDLIDVCYGTFDLNDYLFWNYKSEIEKVIFKIGDYVPNNYVDSYDISLNENGNIMAYVVPNNNDYYNLYIVGKNSIYANFDFSFFFADMYNLKAIENLELLNTSCVESMVGTFAQTSIENLDLTLIDVSNVSDMRIMAANSNIGNLKLILTNTSDKVTVASIFSMARFDSITFASDVSVNLMDASFMFSNSQINNLDISSFDTSNVVDMEMMFWCANIPNLDISSFNTSKVINMFGMFCGLETNQLDISSFNTSNVTNMSEMFSGVSVPELDFSSFNTSKVTNMNRMFASVTVPELDLSSFDTSNVIKMIEMFDRANIPNLDLSSFNTSNVTNMSLMFDYIETDNLDLSSFVTSKVTDMSGMFYGLNMDNLDLSSFVTSNVTDMSSMFSHSSGTVLGLASFDTSKVTDMSSMFYGLEMDNLDLSSFNTSNVTDMSGMFDSATISELDISSFDTSKVTDMGGMFSNFSYDNLDLSSFNTSSLKNVQYMFENFKGTTLDLSSFYTFNITDMSGMFEGAEVSELDLSSFNTSNVTDMGGMFERATISELDLSSFDTSKVTDMSYMFEYITISELDLSSFDTSKVTNARYMFGYASNLRTIYVSDKWSNKSITDAYRMFYNSPKLVGGNGTTYSSSRIDKTYARIDKTGTPGYFTLKN